MTALPKNCEHSTLVRAKTGGWYCISQTGCEFAIPEPASTPPSSKQRNALQLAKSALSHLRPEQCWAVGPATGDPIEDYVVCPGCRALHAIEASLQDETTIEPPPPDGFDSWYAAAAAERALRIAAERHAQSAAETEAKPGIPPFAWIACVNDLDGGGKVELGFVTLEQAQAAQDYFVQSAVKTKAPRCAKHGVELAFDGDKCWECEREARDGSL